jgi:hypothetical protein
MPRSITYLNERQKGKKKRECKETLETDERKEERSHLLTFFFLRKHSFLGKCHENFV